MIDYENPLSAEEAEQISSELDAIDAPRWVVYHRPLGRELVNLYREREVLWISGGVDELLDVDRRTVAKRMDVLLRHGLVRLGKRGYRRMPRLEQYLALSGTSGQTENAH